MLDSQTLFKFADNFIPNTKSPVMPNMNFGAMMQPIEN